VRQQTAHPCSAAKKWKRRPLILVASKCEDRQWRDYKESGLSAPPAVWLLRESPENADGRRRGDGCPANGGSTSHTIEPWLSVLYWLFPRYPIAVSKPNEK